MSHHGYNGDDFEDRLSQRVEYRDNPEIKEMLVDVLKHYPESLLSKLSSKTRTWWGKHQRAELEIQKEEKKRHKKRISELEAEIKVLKGKL